MNVDIPPATPLYNHFFSAAPNAKVNPPEASNVSNTHVPNVAVPPVTPQQAQVTPGFPSSLGGLDINAMVTLQLFNSLQLKMQ